MRRDIFVQVKAVLVQVKDVLPSTADLPVIGNAKEAYITRDTTGLWIWLDNAWCNTGKRTARAALRLLRMARKKS
jgi:hypothetical protein